MHIKVFEAFAGIGAQACALRNIGVDYEVVGISEIDKRAIKAYNLIHGDTPNFGDISKIDPTNLPDIDLFTYSFPCQDLSCAGLGRGINEETRSGLLWECQKIIDAKKPTYLLLENVKQLVGKKHKADFDKWIAYLDSKGYNTYWKVLNAKDFGHAQNRERVYAVSILKEHDKGFTFVGSVPPVHIPFSYVKENNAPEYLYHICPSMLRAIENKKCKVIDDNGLSACLTCKQQRWNNGGFVNDVKGLRYLSGLEQMRLMGFEDADYNAIKDMHITQIDHLCGNSICVGVLESIFINLFVDKE
jgi:site-specific DNA-cytosine methylase